MKKLRTKIVVTKRVKIPRRLKDRIEERIKPIRSRLCVKSIAAVKKQKKTS